MLKNYDHLILRTCSVRMKGKEILIFRKILRTKEKIPKSGNHQTPKRVFEYF